MVRLLGGSIETVIRKHILNTFEFSVNILIISIEVGSSALSTYLRGDIDRGFD